MRKELGKIKQLSLGMGGYQDAMFGFSFTLEGVAWGVQDFWGTWATHYESCKWTVEEQNSQFIEALLKVKKLMEIAKVNNFEKLRNIPIEAEFSENKLVSWRILEEVL